jgi:hypothetical protein
VLSAGERLPAGNHHTGGSDLLLLAESEWQPSTKRVYQQIRKSARGGGGRHADDDALLISVLTAFPDRVARRRQGDELLLAAGGSAVLARESVVRSEDFLVAVDIEERRERGLPLVRLASAIRPEWLLDLYPERVEERASVEWNRTGERVEASSALYYDRLAIQESRDARPDPGQAGRLLAAKAVEAGVGRFTDAGELASLLARIGFAAAHSDLPALGEDDVRQALETLASGLCGAAPGTDRAVACAAARWAAGKGALHGISAAVDRVATAGFLRCAGDAAPGARQSAGGGAPARSQPPARTDHYGPGGLLGTPLSPSAAGVDAALSQARLAGEAVGDTLETQLPSDCGNRRRAIHVSAARQ